MERYQERSNAEWHPHVHVTSENPDFNPAKLEQIARLKIAVDTTKGETPQTELLQNLVLSLTPAERMFMINTFIAEKARGKSQLSELPGNQPVYARESQPTFREPFPRSGTIFEVRNK